MASNNQIALITRDTYSYQNSSQFFSLVNNAFLQYYNTVARKSQQWLDGYDPYFHQGDFVSTRIATKLINGLASSVYGRGLIYEEGKGIVDKSHKALSYITQKWDTESDFGESVKQLIAYTLAFGTGALKISIDGKGKLWCSPLRLDYFYFTLSGKKKLNSITMFVRCFQSVESKVNNYVMVEKRYFKDCSKPFTQEINGVKYKFEARERVPYVIYEIYEFNAPTTQNSMSVNLTSKSPINYKNLPDFVKSALKEEYGAYKIGEEQILPFHNSLGVELFFNEGGDITNPTLPFGRSLCFDCLSDFMEWDLNKSFEIRDLYNSKGIVGVPKALSQSDLIKGQKIDSGFSQMQIEGYELVKGLDPNSQKPIITQFEIRGADHQQISENILKSIATTIGVSPRMLATYLAIQGQKTDDQVQSEDDSITQWIKSRRQDYEQGLNRIVEMVLNHQGISNDVKVHFANDGLLKGDKQLANIRERLSLGMLTIEDAIREYYPDLNEEQLQDKINKALAERNRIEQQQLTALDEEYGENLVNEN